MKIKFQTQQTIPPYRGEIVDGKSETRQSDCMSIKDMLDKYYRQGALVKIYQGANELSDEEKQVYYNEVSDLDLQDMDIVDQKAFVDEQIARLQEVSKTKLADAKEVAKQSPETPADADVPENPDKPEIA